MLTSGEKNGAILRVNTLVEEWRESADFVEVTAGGRTERAKALILCPGAWTPALARGWMCP